MDSPETSLETGVHCRERSSTTGMWQSVAGQDGSIAHKYIKQSAQKSSNAERDALNLIQEDKKTDKNDSFFLRKP
jgi:hypothetical protein